MKNKGKLVAAGMLLAAVAVGAGSTMAYFTDTETKVNVFTMGDLDIGLNEPEWDPGDGDGEDMYPGYTVYKNPTIRNITDSETGQVPCYARMRVAITGPDGEAVTNPEAISLITDTIYYDKSYSGSYSQTGTASGLTQGKVPGYSLKELAAYPMVNPVFVQDKERSSGSELVFNYMGEDGNGILDSGEEAVLFTNVVIPTDWTQKELETVGEFRLVITAECVQSQGFSSQSAAYEALDSELK